MCTLSNEPSHVEGRSGIGAFATTKQAEPSQVATMTRPFGGDWQIDKPCPQSNWCERIPTLLAGVSLRIAICWRTVVNRIWKIPAYDGKYRQYAPRIGGGFGMEAGRQAIALGLQGVFLTATGDDEAGLSHRRELVATGGDAGGVQILPGPTTAAEVVVHNGHRTVLIDLGVPTAEWRPGDSDWSRMMDLDGICLGGTIPDDVVDSVLTKARELGKPAFLNLTRLRSLKVLNLDGVRIVQVSRSDAPNFGFAADAQPGTIAEQFLNCGCDSVIVTESERGERVFDQGGHSVWMPAVPARVPSFPTGCGDVAFMAHLAGYLGGLSMFNWANLGSLAGAYFVEHGRPATWTEIRTLAQEWPPQRRIGS